MMANHLQTQNQQGNTLDGPVAILWDIEYCPVPNGVQAEDVAGNVRTALRTHPLIGGSVTLFSAYGDFNAFSRRLREGCQRTGVKLVDVPSGRKLATDKAILVDMFLFALDNRPPASILLISGDADFSHALHVLGQRGYTVIVVVPAIYDVESALSSAGRLVWDWPTVARGEGFVPPSVVPHRCEPPEYHISCQLSDRKNDQKEEALVSREIPENAYAIPAEMEPVFLPEYAHNWTEFEGTCFSLKCKTPQGLQSNQTEVSKFSKNRRKQQTLRVEPLKIGKKHRKKLKMKQKKHSAPAKINTNLYNKCHPVSKGLNGASCSLAEYNDCSRVLSNPNSNEIPLVGQNGFWEHALPMQSLHVDKKLENKLNKQNRFGVPSKIDSTFNHRHSSISKKSSGLPSSMSEYNNPQDLPSEPSNTLPVQNELAHVKLQVRSTNVHERQAKKRKKKKFSGSPHLLFECSIPQSLPSEPTEVPPVEKCSAQVKLEVQSRNVDGIKAKKRQRKKNTVKLNENGEPASPKFHFKYRQVPVESNRTDNSLDQNGLQSLPSNTSEDLMVHRDTSEAHKLEEHSLDIICISD